jgi:hypothetical protein
MPEPYKPFPSAGVAKFSMGGKNEIAQKEAKKAAANMVTNVAGDTRAAIKDHIVKSIRDGVSAYETARQLRGVLRPEGATGLAGLNVPQMGAAQKYRTSLMNMGLPQGKVDQKMEKYVAKQIRKRAKTIARTEINEALNKGRQASWDKALKEGALPSGKEEPRKRTHVVSDGGLCIICASTVGLYPRISEPFETFAGAMMHPTFHPNCRCGMGIIRPGIVALLRHDKPHGGASILQFNPPPAVHMMGIAQSKLSAFLAAKRAAAGIPSGKGPLSRKGIEGKAAKRLRELKRELEIAEAPAGPITERVLRRKKRKVKPKKAVVKKIVSTKIQVEMTNAEFKAFRSDKFKPEEIANVLENGRITKIILINTENGGGITDSYRVWIQANDGRILTAIYKPYNSIKSSNFSSKLREYDREVFAYELDKMLGLDLVPETILRDIELPPALATPTPKSLYGKTGSLQVWRDDMESPARKYGNKSETEIMTAGQVEERAKAWLFDYLLNNMDRHLNNILLDKNDKYTAIDHGYTMAEPLLHFRWDYEFKLDSTETYSKSVQSKVLKNWLDTLNKMDFDSPSLQFKKLLDKGWSKEELEAFARRGKKLKKFLELRGTKLVEAIMERPDYPIGIIK